MTANQTSNDTASTEKPRVAVVVFNEGVTDIRVVKEAESLADNGYDVHIFGLGRNQAEHQTPRGVPVTVLPRVYISVNYIITLLLAAALIIFAFVVVNGFVAAAIAIALIFMIGAIVMLLQQMRTQPREDTQPQGKWAASLALLLGIVALIITFLFSSNVQIAVLGRIASVYDNLHDAMSGMLIWASDGALLLVIAYIAARLYFHISTYQTRSEVEAEAAGAHVIDWQRKFRQNLQANFFVSIIEAFNPSIVHCNDLPTTPIGWQMKRRHQTKFIYDSHELWTEQQGLTPAARQRDNVLERRIMARVDGLITVNDSIAAELQNRYPTMPSPVIVRNATRPLKEPLIYDGRLHRRLGLPPEHQILLFHGGIATGRGLEAVVEAAALLPPQWCVVFMGAGRHLDTLKSFASQIFEQAEPPRDRLRFIPPVPQNYLHAWTAGATVGVIPYQNISLNNWFCSPNKLWEYPIAGVPILASPFPEMSKLINEHGVGWLLDDPVTSHGIAEVIWKLTPDMLAEAKENCRSFIAVDNWTLYENRLLDLYRKLQVGKNALPNSVTPSLSATSP